MTSNEFNLVATNIKSDVGMMVKLVRVIEKTLPEQDFIRVEVIVGTVDQKCSRLYSDKMNNGHVIHPQIVKAIESQTLALNQGLFGGGVKN